MKQKIDVKTIKFKVVDVPPDDTPNRQVTPLGYELLIDGVWQATDLNGNPITGLFAGKYFQRVPWTGLKDKMGNEIFQGDFLRNTKYKFTLLIQWGVPGESYAGWSARRMGDSENFPRSLLLYNKNLENCIVVGNFYESPDLWKQY